MKNSIPAALLLAIGSSHAYLPIPIQNVTTNPSPPSRKDIDTLSSAELTLFVLAMQQWQTVTAKNTGGFFQVAGIHGAPHTYWDNSDGSQNTSDGDDESGYCFHTDQNFYLWHRPYLALFEQQMRAVAINISNSWYQPQRATYQAAAATLRLPYWDWAKSSTPGTVPAVISGSTIQVVNSTTGQNVVIKNPLYNYKLVSDGNLGTYDDGTVITVGSGKTTYRGKTYTSDLQKAGAQLQQNTALMFNTPNACWNVFATENSDERKQCNVNMPSLEGTHNTVHNTIGGTMVDLDVSAFDPIFWLHHAQVDRLGALWQAINPNTKVQNTYGDDYTWVVNPGYRDATFPFEPFRASQGRNDWWQPQRTYDVRATNYTYPEIADQPSPNTVLSRVNALYGTGRAQQTMKSKSRRASRRSRRQATAAPTNLIVPPTSEQLAPFSSLLLSKNGSFQEYAVVATIQKSVAPGKSFTLHFFLGDPSTTDYLAATNRVGGLSVAQGGGKSMNTSVSGVITITNALLNVLITGKIKDLKPATIRKYVRARLVWRLVEADGTEIPVQRGKQNGLQINVQHTVVTPPPVTNALPVVEAPVQVADTTNNTVAAPIPSDVKPTTSLPASTSTPTNA